MNICGKRPLALRQHIARPFGGGRHLRLCALLAVLAVAICLPAPATAEEPADALSRARQLQDAGKLDAAVRELKKRLRRQPDDGQARALLGKIYITLGDGAAAEKELTRARDLGQDAAELRLALLRSLVLQEKYDELVGRLLTIESGPSAESLLALRGDAYFGRGELSKAESDYRRLLRENARSGAALRGLASIALARGEFRAAETHLKRAVELSEEDEGAWRLMGELALSRTRFESAHDAFRRALERVEDDPQALAGAGRALLGLDMPDAAEAYLEAAADNGLGDPEAAYFVGLAAALTNRHGHAQSVLFKLLKETPRHSLGMLVMAGVHYSRGQIRQAEALLTRLMSSPAQNGAARRLLAAVYIELAQPEKAVALLSKGIAIRDQDLSFAALMGNARLAAGAIREAIPYFQRVDRLAGFDAQARVRLAAVRLLGGDANGALADLRRAAAFTADSPVPVLLRTLALLHKDDPTGAVAALDELEVREERKPLSHLLRGVSLSAQGEFPAARQAFEEALAIEPEYAPASLALARMDLREERFDAAESRYASASGSPTYEVGARIGMARVLEKRGRGEEAFHQLSRARTVDLRDLGPRLVLADLYLQRGDFDMAIEIAEEAARIAPDHPRTLLALGRVQWTVGQSKAAVVTYRRLAALPLGSAAAFLRVALAQREAGDLEGARGALERGLGLDSGHLPTKLVLGAVALALGDTERATELASALKAKHPDLPAGDMLQGDVLAATGQAEAALAAYGRAHQLKRSGATVRKLAAAQRLQGNDKAARDLLADWLSAYAGDNVVRLALAEDYRLSGDLARATAQYDAIIERDPNNALALVHRARLYDPERESKKALRLGQRAFEVAPTHPDVLDTYGWLLILENEIPRGLSLMDIAVSQRPDNGSFRYHRAVGLARIGRFSQAEAELEALLDSGQAFPELEKARAALEQLR